MAARPLYEVAQDVRKNWPRVNFGAEPYLAAMEDLDKVTDRYYADSAESVVRYFLSNATSWRGEDARRVKTELRKLVA